MERDAIVHAICKTGNQRNDETCTRPSNKNKLRKSSDQQVTGRSQMHNVQTKQRDNQQHCEWVPETGAKGIQKET